MNHMLLVYPCKSLAELADPLRLAAELLEGAGRLEEARARLRAALPMAPDSWRITSSLAELEARLNSLKEELSKKEQQHTEAMKKLEAIEFACEADAEKAFWTFTNKPKLHRLTVGCTSAEVSLPRKRRGRPKKDEPAPTKTVWRLQTRSIEINQEAVERARVYARFFVLITDHLDTERWPDKRVLAEYRHQRMIEGHTGFRWLKGPNMVAPMMLNTPARIAALGMVFVLALLVRNYIQATIRAELAELNGLTFPNMDYKPTRSPTTENVFWLFRNVGSVVVSKGGFEIHRRVTGLDEHCRLAMRLLGVTKRAFVEPRKRL